MMHIPSCHNPLTLCCLCVILGKSAGVCFKYCPDPGDQGYKPPNILLTGQVVKPQSNFSPSQTSQGVCISLSTPIVSIRIFSLLPSFGNFSFREIQVFIFASNLFCKGGSLSYFRVCLGPEKLFLSHRAAVRHPSDVSHFLLEQMGTGL